MHRFLLTPRRPAGILLALAAVAVCLRLGSWQLGRFKEKAAAQHAVPLPPGQLGTLTRAAPVNILPYAVHDGWVAADTAPTGLMSLASLQPRSGDGLNLRAFQSLGYTLEWFVFAGFVAFMGFRPARHEAEAAEGRAFGLDLGASTPH
ncbi:hypothetical protein KNE206_73950 [Kitasatospora sp. NE20-6]|uniref:hypothetical protein n=1 Tax=Kitasatospora sp. NE20-6 TaxID=2859066 RepID=UPI0034DBA12F